MVERRDLLDRDFLPRRLVEGRAAELSRRDFYERKYEGLPDDTISTFAHYILDIILVRNVERYLPGTTGWSLLARHDSYTLVARLIAERR